VTIKAPAEKRLVEIGGREFELKQVEESPCRHACPAGIDVKRYVGQIADGDFASALTTIRGHMPFPSACGRICLHPCETECARAVIDKPIAIMALKRFAIDYEFQKGNSEPLPTLAPSTGKRVAVIGSGPTGLTAAHDLALMGHSVRVFERSDRPG
jgi:formate dehydrogenase major subunit